MSEKMKSLKWYARIQLTHETNVKLSFINTVFITISRYFFIIINNTILITVSNTIFITFVYVCGDVTDKVAFKYNGNKFSCLELRNIVQVYILDFSSIFSINSLFILMCPFSNTILILGVRICFRLIQY